MAVCLWQDDVIDDSSCCECEDEIAKSHCKKCGNPMCRKCHKFLKGICNDCADNVYESKFDDVDERGR